MTFEGPIELIARLLGDDKVDRVLISKHEGMTPQLDVRYTATYDLADSDVQVDIGDGARVPKFFSDEPEPEKPMRLTRWFGKVLDKANRELLAQDGAKAVSWKTKSPRELFQKMAQHIQELDVAIAQNKNWFGSMHATDIVNYALMIATRCTAISDGSEEWK